MSGNPYGKARDKERIVNRIHTVEKISVNYEGRNEEVADRLPDVSPQGMFINTSQRFPEGAVLNLSFRLALSGAQIRTRCEVRYCQPGIGVGVEFIGITPEATRQIETEIAMCRAGVRKKRLVRKARKSRK
jgi:hypothetical protein